MEQRLPVLTVSAKGPKPAARCRLSPVLQVATLFLCTWLLLAPGSHRSWALPQFARQGAPPQRGCFVLGAGPIPRSLGAAPTNLAMAAVEEATFLPPWTWYNILLTAYYGITTLVVGPSQVKGAKESPAAWSKFAIGKDFKMGVPGRVAMLVKYVPPIVLMALWAVTGHDLYITFFLMVIHFGKRILEVCFVHTFSGSPTEELPASVIIAIFYSISAWFYYRQAPLADGMLETIGLVLFCVGQAGNLYHHVLLKNLRSGQTKEGEDKYKIPCGGLFELVACPHYFFEVISFLGAALVAFNLNALLHACWTASLLSGTSVATSAWYAERFGARYPSSRKNIVPYLF